MIPSELKDRDQWLLWAVEERDGDPTKVPRRADDPTRRASSTDPETWASFEEAADAADHDDIAGIGFVFSPDDTVLGIDLDNCRDADTGEVDPWAAEIVAAVDSFTEVSPSGTGLHIFVRGVKPGDRCRRAVEDDDARNGAKVEMYDDARFFTVTGDHVADTPETVERRQAAVKELYNQHLAERKEIGDVPEPSPAPGNVDLEDAELLDKAREADNGDSFTALFDRGDLSAHDGDHSRADLALMNHLAFWTGGDRGRMERLFGQSALGQRDKWRDRDDYRSRTIDAALRSTTDFYEPPSDNPQAAADGGATATAAQQGGEQDTSTAEENELLKLFREACEFYNVNPERVSVVRGEGGERYHRGLDRILHVDSVASAVMSFNEEADDLSGTQRQAVIARAVSLDLNQHGEFFQTPHGDMYYFYTEDKDMYRVDGDGRRVLNEDFQAFAWEQYNLLAGQFSRNLGNDILSHARRNAPEREVHQFAHYDEEAGELYVTDWGDGYYAINADGIEWRPNGTDLFFLSLDRAEPYQYLEPENRPALPDAIPGELSMWQGSGDAIMRLFGNRVNYSEDAALAPAQQRQQLYIHLHVLPFAAKLIGRPIMAWVGEKGSGKTMTSRAIGKHLIGSGFTESLMPDARDDFEAKVVNQPLAFIDNYDEGEDWANSMLAAIATGTAVDKRELYTTSGLRSEVPDCWLSLTSREPPFRRDDVADRLLLFHVERFEGDFIGEGDFLAQIQNTDDHPQRRDLLWSVYLDNLQSVLAELEQRDTGRMSSSHRMAGWAIMAQFVADALGMEHVSELLETMEAERATFALEGESWAVVLGDWINDNPRMAGEWRKASDLHEQLEQAGEKNNRQYDVTTTQTLGKKLTKYHDELGTIYGLEIDDSGRTNKYRFDADGEGRRSGLGQF